MSSSDPQAPLPGDTPVPPSNGETPPEGTTVPTVEEVQATRSKRTFWQRLGGEGLTISLIIHLVLILIAIRH